MSLLDDTVRDARRPLFLRREANQRAIAASDEATLAPGDDALADKHAYPGELPWQMTREMQAQRDVGRDDFRREGQSMSREASPPFGSGFSRLPAGDPLSAVMGAERPKSSAKNVGFSDVTVMGDSRTSELATGPEKGRSPGKVAAAAAGSESMAFQSVVLPGSSEAEWSRARSLSMAPEGSTTTVSAGGETFLSRPPGRGAPSENPCAASVGLPVQAEATPGGDAAPPDGVVWRASGNSPIDKGTRESHAANASNALTGAVAPSGGRRGPGTARAGQPDDAPAPGVADTPPSPSFATEQGRTAVRARAVIDARSVGGPGGAFARVQPSAAASTGDSVPTLRIGRIDVTVVADAVPAAPASLPEGFSDAGFLARNYLKRL